MLTQDALAALRSAARRRVLESLLDLPSVPKLGRVEGGKTAREVSGELDLHVTTVRHHLERLEDAGLVEQRTERRGIGRPKQYWSVSRSRIADVRAAESFHLLGDVVATSDPDDDLEDAGRRWAHEHAAGSIGEPLPTGPATSPGQFLARIGVLFDLLDRWGYEPDLVTSDSGHTATLSLHHCPLLGTASTPSVVCAVHRGVIAGALDLVCESGARVSLRPFESPEHCDVVISTDQTFDPPERPHERP